MFIRREDAKRFVEEVRGDDPEVAAKLRIEERDLEKAGRRNYQCQAGPLESRLALIVELRRSHAVVGHPAWLARDRG